jgi:hypothetical protein
LVEAGQAFIVTTSWHWLYSADMTRRKPRTKIAKVKIYGLTFGTK